MPDKIIVMSDNGGKNVDPFGEYTSLMEIHVIRLFNQFQGVTGSVGCTNSGQRNK